MKIEITRRRLIGSAMAAPFVAPAAPALAQADRRPVMNIAVAELPPTLEPANELSNVGTRVTYSIFDTLIRRDFLGSPDGGGSGLKPHLAESWERRSARELIVRLREGVKFHNGDTLTAEDVVFTFAEGRLWGEKPTIAEGPAYFGVLESVSALDARTVRFVTRAADVLLEQRLSSWASWIVNKRAYTTLGMDGFGQAPVGTGPFRVRRLARDQILELEAFDDYFLGRPTARQVNFRAVPQLATRLAGLAAGEFDMITNVPPDQIPVINRVRDAEARSVVIANSHMLTYNDKGPAIADKRVRQALSMAIDRKALVDGLWLGQAVVPPSHNYPEFGDMFLPGRELKFDAARARQLLREAGYRGEPIVYRAAPHYYTRSLDAGQVIIEMWKSVGVNASLQVVENFTQMRAAGAQVGQWSNSTRLPDPLGALWVSWGPAGIQQRIGQFSNVAEFNAAGRALEGEIDLAKRRALFARMLDIWEDEAPGTILYQPLETYGIKKSIAWRPYTFFFMDLRPDNLSFSAA
jgi:peptide/nickel transport system substrate-binding protein